MMKIVYAYQQISVVDGELAGWLFETQTCFAPTVNMVVDDLGLAPSSKVQHSAWSQELQTLTVYLSDHQAPPFCFGIGSCGWRLGEVLRDDLTLLYSSLIDLRGLGGETEDNDITRREFEELLKDLPQSKLKMPWQ